MAKLNGNGKWVITSVVAIIAVCLTVAGVILAAGGKLAKVDVNEKNIIKNAEHIDLHAARINRCEAIDEGRKRDIEYIREQLSEIKAVNTQVLEYLRTSHHDNP